ncbi:MAG: MgtC/SapB family protein [Alphaproteobacteria bacterium]|nr:MgtC/SapB family protein [Alphaproteobacteria bacterium]
MLDTLFTHENIKIISHLGFAMLAGGFIGLERSYYGRPAGFRTHTLVCLASSVLMVVTVNQLEWMGTATPDVIKTDPTRMAQGIMTGIGFLGAGVIYKEGFTVRGLTTAASIWITAAIGILFGVGLYFPATLATFGTIGILSLFHRVERWMPKHSYVHFNISFARKSRMPEDQLRQVLKSHGFSIGNVSYHIVDDGEISEYRSIIRTKDHTAVKRLAEYLIAMETVHEFKIAPSGD